MRRLARRALLGTFAALALMANAGAAFAAGQHPVRGQGVIVWRSAMAFADTVAHLQNDVLAKKIRLFDVIDQTKLAAGAGITLRPSTLLVFGNPPLGIQFLTANPLAGLDWPVRLLVYEDERHTVWIACNDFEWISRRHGITDRNAAFTMATKVVGSIVSSVGAVRS